tara:strand:+ start:1098 stop:1310 length:213 start_codon:yes stop_codon:yes gene_type:complete
MQNTRPKNPNLTDEELDVIEEAVWDFYNQCTNTVKLKTAEYALKKIVMVQKVRVWQKKQEDNIRPEDISH